MAQPTKQLPILYTLDNRNMNHSFVAVAFSMIKFLFLCEESSVKTQLETINLFNISDFDLLSARISNVRNKEVVMNEKHLVIFYTVFYLLTKALNSDDEMSIIQDTKEDEDEEITMSAESRAAYLAFAKQSTFDLKRDFSKNHYLAGCMAKINAC